MSITTWPKNFESLVASLRNTRIPKSQADAFAAKLEATLAPEIIPNPAEDAPEGSTIPKENFSREEKQALVQIFASRVCEENTPEAALPLAL